MDGQVIWISEYGGNRKWRFTQFLEIPSGGPITRFCAVCWKDLVWSWGWEFAHRQWQIYGRFVTDIGYVAS